MVHEADDVFPREVVADQGAREGQSDNHVGAASIQALRKDRSEGYNNGGILGGRHPAFRRIKTKLSY
jgi:hypothetical protein